MKNVPRIFAGDNVQSGQEIPVSGDVVHYLTRVMRRRDCLCFGGGHEFLAGLNPSETALIVGDDTGRPDSSNDLTLFFAPIKRLDDLMNMATQLGIGRFQPVITDRTVANHINWSRMNKIVTEAAEQSNRNSVPRISEPKKFSELDFSQIVFADERAAQGCDIPTYISGVHGVLVGPEGGFSDSEFNTLDKSGARPLSLGKTVLRAEVAAVIAIDRIKNANQNC